MGESVNLAREVARLGFEFALPERWARLEALAAKVEETGRAAGLDDEALDQVVSAAYLHQVGLLHPDLFQFYPLDGALWLQPLADPMVVSLVAWQGTSMVMAALVGLSSELEMVPMPDETMAEVLAYGLLTTGRDGADVTREQLLVELRARHGVDAVPVLALEAAWDWAGEVIARYAPSLTA